MNRGENNADKRSEYQTQNHDPSPYSQSFQADIFSYSERKFAAGRTAHEEDLRSCKFAVWSVVTLVNA